MIYSQVRDRKVAPLNEHYNKFNIILDIVGHSINVFKDMKGIAAYVLQE